MWPFKNDSEKRLLRRVKKHSNDYKLAAYASQPRDFIPAKEVWNLVNDWDTIDDFAVMEHLGVDRFYSAVVKHVPILRPRLVDTVQSGKVVHRTLVLIATELTFDMAVQLAMKQNEIQITEQKLAAYKEYTDAHRAYTADEQPNRAEDQAALAQRWQQAMLVVQTLEKEEAEAIAKKEGNK